MALGIELRRTELKHDEIATLVAAWNRVLTDPSIELTEAQAGAIRRGVAGALRSMDDHVETRELEELVR